MKIERFSVFGLHGKLDYVIKIEDNSLILVAENGSGKTTLVNIFYYFLSRQWKRLNEYQFEKIEMVINSRVYTYDKKKILDIDNFKSTIQKESRFKRMYPAKFMNIAEILVERYNPLDLIRNIDLIERLSIEYEVPSRFIRELGMFIEETDIHIEKSTDIQKLENNLCKILSDIQIVYLPTYRRIERDLKNIFPHMEETMKNFESRRRRGLFQRDNNNDFIELVEFGMEDVRDRVQQRCDELRGYFYNNLSGKITGSYLEDILNKRYKNFDTKNIQSFSDEALEYLLNRLDDSIISKNGKKELKAFVEKVREKKSLGDEDKINAYFVWKLFQIYEEQQNAETDINKFVDICNDYIKDSKYFKYDKDNFMVSIHLKYDDFTNLSKSLFDLLIEEHSPQDRNAKNTIDYKDLSSGEKQIVSLFSHLILNKKKYFIIIDEPELSLSVPWQERLLPDIINSEDCLGILSVTHSPFIFNNILKKYSHSLEEFLV